jgi:hypothetical protein
VQETATSAELGLAGRQGFVAYSLGNLLFDQEQGETRHGLALRAYFDGEGLRAVQGLPVQAGPRPRLEANPPSPLLVAEDPAGRVGPEVTTEDLSLVVANGPPSASDGEAGPGVRSVQAIDLTGDGLPEEVRLEDEQVVVYEGGTEVWRGLPEWRVVDLALGDPEDDGRGEIVLALWKEDEQGVPRSHPFIVGYRGGSYRVLWGGSALSRPIHEVALGDLDGDGAQELIVLEEAGLDGLLAVAAWQWHGWGFSLWWRSAPGAYRNLSLLPGAEGDPARIAVEVEP